ncbi:TatD family hydrolase [Desulfococcaceae bacterium HSG9]|nr:TatD family hydrolase [Desulfococcaceae bacterium HSG9]
MKLFDSHCHLDDAVFEKDIAKVYHRMDEADVVKAMTVGTDRKSSQKTVALADARKHLYAAVGIHPHNAENSTASDLDILRNLAANPTVKAWGEIGLDFNRMYSPVKSQEICLHEQIEIAGKLKLPIIFHERDSHGRLLEILETRKNKIAGGVIHCFSGNQQELKRYLNMGFYIGITGILTIKGRGAFLRELAVSIPAEQILIETDAPYLTPAPQKNKTRRNEPAFVRSVLVKLALIRKEDPEILADVLWNNTCRLFKVGIQNSEC